MLERIASASFQPVKAPGTQIAGKPILKAGGPFAVLGWTGDLMPAPITPNPSSLFGPRGVCLHPDGSFWVADTGHHRLLGWRTCPDSDNTPADIVIGQKGFLSEGRNGKGPVGPATLNVPTGICAWGEGLAVADAWNHRVLLWRRTPTHSHAPADIVLGQTDMTGGLANRGADSASAVTLNWPYAVAEIDGTLFVGDTGNRRVLAWSSVEANGAPADLVLGQTDFDSRDENAGTSVGSLGMRWPHAIARWKDGLAVADAGNNRIMLWRDAPATSGAPCDDVIGQADASACDHNGASYYPSAATLNMPYAIAVSGENLVVADTANSRLIAFDTAETGAAAYGLAGQPDFAAKGDNRWGLPQRDSLCWPYGLSLRGSTIAIADSGNNRVLLWECAS